MNRTEKTEAVEALAQGLAQSSNAILFAFAGLKVPDVTELRRQVRGTQSTYLVVKNTLALRATKGTALEALFGLQMLHESGIYFGLGAGPGLSEGPGTPALRGIAAAGFAPGARRERAATPAQAPEPPAPVDEEPAADPVDQVDRCVGGAAGEEGCPEAEGSEAPPTPEATPSPDAGASSGAAEEPAVAPEGSAPPSTGTSEDAP